MQPELPAHSELDDSQREEEDGRSTEGGPIDWKVAIGVLLACIALSQAQRFLLPFFPGQCTTQVGLCTPGRCRCPPPLRKQELVTDDDQGCYRCIDKVCPAVAEGSAECTAAECDCEDPKWPRVDVHHGDKPCWQCVQPSLDFVARAGLDVDSCLALRDASQEHGGEPAQAAGPVNDREVQLPARVLESTRGRSGCLPLRFTGAQVTERRDKRSCLVWQPAGFTWTLAQCDYHNPRMRFRELSDPGSGDRSGDDSPPRVLCVAGEGAAICLEVAERLCTEEDGRCSTELCRCENNSWTRHELVTRKGSRRCFMCTPPADDCTAEPESCSPEPCQCSNPAHSKLLVGMSPKGNSSVRCVRCGLQARRSKRAQYLPTLGGFIGAGLLGGFVFHWLSESHSGRWVCRLYAALWDVMGPYLAVLDERLDPVFRVMDFLEDACVQLGLRPGLGVEAREGDTRPAKEEGKAQPDHAPQAIKEEAEAERRREEKVAGHQLDDAGRADVVQEADEEAAESRTGKGLALAAETLEATLANCTSRAPGSPRLDAHHLPPLSAPTVVPNVVVQPGGGPATPRSRLLQKLLRRKAAQTQVASGQTDPGQAEEAESVTPDDSWIEEMEREAKLKVAPKKAGRAKDKRRTKDATADKGSEARFQAPLRSPTQATQRERSPVQAERQAEEVLGLEHVRAAEEKTPLVEAEKVPAVESLPAPPRKVEDLLPRGQLQPDTKAQPQRQKVPASRRPFGPEKPMPHVPPQPQEANPEGSQLPPTRRGEEGLPEDAGSVSACDPSQAVWTPADAFFAVPPLLGAAGVQPQVEEQSATGVVPDFFRGGGFEAWPSAQPVLITTLAACFPPLPAGGFVGLMESWGLGGTYDFLGEAPIFGAGLLDGGQLQVLVNFTDAAFALLFCWVFRVAGCPGDVRPADVQGFEAAQAYWSQHCCAEVTSFCALADKSVAEMGFRPSGVAPAPVVVAAVEEGSWADRLGIAPGDELVAINGRAVAELTPEEMRNMRGSRPLRLALERRRPAVTPTVVRNPVPSQWAVDSANSLLATRPGAQCRKTRMCTFHSQGRCEKGPSCSFAHAEEELQPLPDFAKTKLCHNFFSGRCAAPKCRFAHGSAELRSSSWLLGGGAGGYGFMEGWPNAFAEGFPDFQTSGPDPGGSLDLGFVPPEVGSFSPDFVQPHAMLHGLTMRDALAPSDAVLAAEPAGRVVDRVLSPQHTTGAAAGDAKVSAGELVTLCAGLLFSACGTSTRGPAASWRQMELDIHDNESVMEPIGRRSWSDGDLLACSLDAEDTPWVEAPDPEWPRRG